MVTLDHVTLGPHALDENRDFLVAAPNPEVGNRPDIGLTGYGSMPVTHRLCI